MSEELQKGLDYPSKLSRQPTFIDRLIADGERQASAFLAKIGDTDRPVRRRGGAAGGREPGRARHRQGLRNAPAPACACAGAVLLCLGASVRACAAPPPPAPEATQAPPPPAAPVVTPAPDAKAAEGWKTPHYDEGFVLAESPEGAELPFRLRLNHVSQFKYTNTLAVNDTFTDHLGRVHEVLRRNDIQLTRDVFYFSGYAFDKPAGLQHHPLHVERRSQRDGGRIRRASCSTRAFALRAGFFSLPSLRAMTGTYPYFHGTDRSMATNYMRPGFTQGVWANGELLPGFNYIAMVGNSLNTLNISASRIDYNFAYGTSVWYDWNKFGNAWGDYERHDSVALRIGGAFTYAREDRLSDLATQRSGEQLDVHVGRHAAVRDRLAGGRASP